MKILKIKKAATPTKINTDGFDEWKEKMRRISGNFRQRAEQAGVPPERVMAFKYWLKGRIEKLENQENRK